MLKSLKYGSIRCSQNVTYFMERSAKTRHESTFKVSKIMPVHSTNEHIFTFICGNHDDHRPDTSQSIYYVSCFASTELDSRKTKLTATCRDVKRLLISATVAFITSAQLFWLLWFQYSCAVLSLFLNTFECSDHYNLYYRSETKSNDI